MGKEIGRFSKLIIKNLTSTIKKTVLLSLAAHTSYGSTSKQTYISSELDNKDIFPNKNKNNTRNTEDIHSCVTPRKQNYSVHATSKITHLTLLNSILHIASVKLYTTTKLPLTGKKYLCFLIDKKYLRLPSVSSNTHRQYLSISIGLFNRDNVVWIS